MQNAVRYLVILFALLFSAPIFAQNNTVKATLLSLGSGSTRLSYERALSYRRSAELTVGFIGAGFDILNHADPVGYLLKACYKWNLLPQPRSTSPLAGLYVKPELIWADYSYHPDGDLEHHTHQLALLAEGGYQLMLKWFIFDAYCGLGPTIGTGNSQNYYHGFMCYPVPSTPTSSPLFALSFTAGFRLGYAF